MVPRSDERPNCIGLQVDGKYMEGRCSTVAFLPGTLLEITTNVIDNATQETDLNQLPPFVKKNSVSGTPIVMVALEDRLGNTPTSIQGRTIDTAYVPLSGLDADAVDWYGGDVVGMVQPAPGDVLMCRVGTNSAFVVGALLKAHTDGTLIAQGGSGTGIAIAAETRNFNGVEQDVATPLLRVQFI